MEMRQEQEQEQTVEIYIVRLYNFLKERDAKIIELFFLGLHLWLLTVFALPDGTFNGQLLAFAHQHIPQLVLVLLQTIIVCLNLTALLYESKYVRVASALVNVAYMLLLSTGFALLLTMNMGTYFLLALLAAFVSWKVQIKQ